MENELKQLDSVRRKAAFIKKYIEHLQSLSGHSFRQRQAIESARIAFNKIVAVEIKDLRFEAGDENYNNLETIDFEAITSGFSYRPDVVISEIKNELSQMMKLAYFICDSNIDALIKAISDFQCFELGELNFAFK